MMSEPSNQTNDSNDSKEPSDQNANEIVEPKEMQEGSTVPQAPEGSKETSNDPADASETAETSSSAASTLGGWFSSIVQTAKQTVNKTTMESIRRDLNEFKDALQQDTTQMISSTASLVKNTFNEIGNTVTELGSLGTNSDDQSELKDMGPMASADEDAIKNDTETNDSASKILDINIWADKLSETAKSTMNIVKDTFVDSILSLSNDTSVNELDDEPCVIIDGNIVKIENWPQELRKLQLNKKTYLQEPSGPPDNYEQWLVSFNLINYQKQMQYLLTNVPEIAEIHRQLVPEQLSDSDFWHRYYYNVYQLQEKLANQIRKDYAKNKSSPQDNNTQQSPASSTSKSDIEWDKLSTAAASNQSTKTQTTGSSKCSSDDDADRSEWVKM